VVEVGPKGRTCSQSDDGQKFISPGGALPLGES
jgi:hypothetical protein